MKEVISYEYEDSDYKLFNDISAGKYSKVDLLSLDIPHDLKKIALLMYYLFEDKERYNSSKSRLLMGLPELPIELRHKYFESLIKDIQSPVKEYDCEGKSVVRKYYPLLEK